MSEPYAWTLTAAFCLVMLRCMVKWASEEWYFLRAKQVTKATDALRAGTAGMTTTCTAFHTIMNQPKPWFVRLHEWLGRRHV